MGRRAAESTDETRHAPSPLLVGERGQRGGRAVAQKQSCGPRVSQLETQPRLRDLGFERVALQICIEQGGPLVAKVGDAQAAFTLDEPGTAQGVDVGLPVLCEGIGIRRSSSAIGWDVVRR